MLHKNINLFGIRLDNLNTHEVVEKILKLIEFFPKNKTPQYVCTLNTDFLSNFLSWNPGKPLNPELFKVIHDSAIVTPDGMPIIWLSHLLRTPLKERVAGIDLVSELCLALGEKEKSIFLLGGNEETNKTAIQNLKEKSPKLKIAGMACPYVSIQGEKLVHAEEFDALILEEINRSSPDVLLINLGNPKQEIWFERIKEHLAVPVSIGIGGTLDKLGGRLKRAPDWMQNYGLEWLHRLFQEPKRLWKRYLVDFFKFPYVTVPLVTYDLFTRLVSITSSKNPPSKSVSLLFLSPNQSIATLHLPRLLNSETSSDIRNEVENVLEHDIIILDFQSVRHIDPVGVQFIMSLWHRILNEKKEVFGLKVSFNVRTLLKLYRVWGTLSNRFAETSEEVLLRLAPLTEHPPLYESVQQYSDSGYVVLSFLGQLDSERDYDRYFLQFLPLINQKDCIIDLQYCTFIENAGFSFLLRIRQHQELQHHKLNIVGLSSELKKQFELAEVLELFQIHSKLEDVVVSKTFTEVV